MTDELERVGDDLDRRLFRSLASLGAMPLPGEKSDEALLGAVSAVGPAATATIGWTAKLTLVVVIVTGAIGASAVLLGALGSNRDDNTASASPPSVMPQSPELPATESEAPAAAVPAPILAESAAEAAAVPPTSTPTLEPVAIPQPRAASGPATERAGDPEQWLSRAQQAYAEGRLAAALREYRGLIREFPRSEQARAARVSLGRIELARGHAAAALRQFDAYLGSPGGMLAKEAERGRILALRKLGRSEREREAILEFLREHPTDLHADALSKRAAELSP